MSKHLHVGVVPAKLHVLIREVDRYRHDFPGIAEHPVVNGDGWETWGEAVGTDLNDNETLHVIIPVVSGRWGEYVALHLASRVPLVRMTAEYQAGIWACVTDAADWSEDARSLRDPLVPTPGAVVAITDEELRDEGAYVDHANDLGDWCPFSGSRVTTTDGYCPQLCGASSPGDEEDTVEILWEREYLVGRIDSYTAEVPRHLFEAHHADVDDDEARAALDAWVVENGDQTHTDEVELTDEQLTCSDVTQ